MVLMVVMTIIIALQIVYRYLLGDPLIWSEEAARFIFVWIVFLGASTAVRERAHVGISFLVDKLPPRPRVGLSLAFNLFVLFFLGVIFYYGARATRNVWDQDALTIDISFGIVYLAIPVSAALMVLRTLQVMREDAADFRAGRARAHEDKPIT